LNVSVIIPTLNEESCVAHTLERLARDKPAEIIVADGGSHDATVEIAARWARVVETPRGRAIQQNAAARAASGDILLFLHADCWPELGWQTALQRAMQRADCVAGCFQMHIDRDGLVYRAIDWGGDLRVRWLSLPYGDQGIFMRRDLFWKFGGFPTVSLMEDLLLMRRIRLFGRVELVQHSIHVSPRRWEKSGAVCQTFRNWTLAALAVWFGVHPDRLVSLYPAVR
jgi:rSAM/selenodomain-associated transferase 2